MSILAGQILATNAGGAYELWTNITTGGLRIGHSLTSGTLASGNNKTSGDVMNNSPSLGRKN